MDLETILFKNLTPKLSLIFSNIDILSVNKTGQVVYILHSYIEHLF